MPSRRPRWLVPAGLGALLVIVLGVVLARGGSKPAPTPSPTPAPTAQPLTGADLYAALVRTPIDDSELPPGFTGAKPTELHLSDTDRGNKLVGNAYFEIKGPDTFDYIQYFVYETKADANRGLEKQGPNGTVTGTTHPPDLETPSECFNSTEKFTDTQAPFGRTSCFMLDGDVVPEGISDLQSATDHGNQDSSVALAKAARAHLDKVLAETRASGPPV